ncbi:MAG: putative Uncharacterized metalloprotease yhfN, partial [Holophagaceae bacterium]|nr:putative Uncharacterized metalloprotease yhfN [Holophagaceae bacterium]
VFAARGCRIVPVTSRWIPGWLALALVVAAVLMTTSMATVSAAWAAPHSGNIPPEIAAHFTPEDVARGESYMQGRYWLFAVGTFLRLAVLAVLVFTPTSAALRTLAVRLTPAHPAVAVAIYIALLTAAFEIVTLPLGFYAGFVREHAFGLSTQTPVAWLMDRLKGAAISLVLAVPLGSLLVLLWRRYPGRWVLPAWVLGGLTVILLVALAPVVIDPLFNTIRPLPDPALKGRVLALAGPRRAMPISPAWAPPSGSCCTTTSWREATPTRWSWSSPTRWVTGSMRTSGRGSG